MASKFAFPDWAFDDLRPAVPVPPPSPEEAEANDARVNDLKNQFIDYKQQVLYTAPQAFLRQQGSDAITRAGEADEILDTLRQQTLDQTANVHQRTRLDGMLDWHLTDAKEQIHRHVVEQSNAWQQSVAARTVELATKQAALESGDAEKVGFVALAAYDAEKARAIKAGIAPELAHESGRVAWSGAYKAAIETQAGTDPQQAVKLFRQAQYTLDPQTREALQPRIDDLSRGAEADALADKALVPGADRASILDDPAITPEVKRLAESKIAMRETTAAAVRQSQIDALDSRLGSDAPEALAKANYMPGTYATIADGYAAAGDLDRTASARQLAANETLLTGFAGMTPADQAVALDKLEPGPVRDQALRIKDATDRMLANDPLRWGTTTQRANGVGELVPLDLTPSPTNTPQTIAAALGQRQQQARLIEKLSGRPTPAITHEEIAALKAKLDEVPPDQQSKLLGPLAALPSDAISSVAQALASGDNGDARSRSYAAAFALLAGNNPQRAMIADQILRGAQIRKDSDGQGASASSNAWQRALLDDLASASLDTSRMAPAIATDAIAAVYAWQMSQQGCLDGPLDRDVLDKAIVAVTGGPAIRTGQSLSLADNGVDVAQQPAGRGVAPNVEPPPGNPEYQALSTAPLSAEEAATSRGAERSGMNEDGAVASVGVGSTAAAEGAGAVGARATTLIASAMATTPAVFASIPLLLASTNTQDSIVELGDNLRVRQPIGGRLAFIERRVRSIPIGKGVSFGWETLPIAATFADEPDGRLVLRVDPSQLESAIGSKATNRLLKSNGLITASPSSITLAPSATPPSSDGDIPIIPIPSYWEHLIGEYSDKGKTIAHYHRSDAEIEEVCPSYPKYLAMALQSAAEEKANGLQNGMVYGNAVHESVRAKLQLDILQQKLEMDQVLEVAPEVAFLNGVRRRTSYSRPKNSSVIDIIEFYRKKTVCVYDIKTGNARFPKRVMDRYGREIWSYIDPSDEAILYSRAAAAGYTHVYVVPIRVP